jgi:methylated-DNA-protein-cysteine methyltransferase-like protein
VKDDDELRRAILFTLSLIPEGKVSTYGDIANKSGFPGKARFVGYILKNLPPDSHIPWHRVVNCQGKIAFPHDSDKYLEQKEKLLSEGVEFTNLRVPMSFFRWH